MVDPMESMLSDAIKHDLENKLNSRVSSAGMGENGDGALPNAAPNTVEHDETFNRSMYILVILTFIVIVVFFNWFRKGKNNVRTRRKYFLLNKLGF